MMKRSENINDIDSARVEVGDYHRGGERENTMFRWLFYEFAFLGCTILGYVVCLVRKRVSDARENVRRLLCVVGSCGCDSLAIAGIVTRADRLITCTPVGQHTLEVPTSARARLTV